MELEGVLCDVNSELGGPGFDEVCKETIERVRDALLVLDGYVKTVFKDAQRYDWLRKQTGALVIWSEDLDNGVGFKFRIHGEFIGCEPAAIDEAIDTVMKKEEQCKSQSPTTGG